MVATRLLSDHEGEAGAFFINDRVLVEVMWVLGRSCEIPRSDAVEAMQSLLDNDAVVFQDRDRLTRAVALCTQQAVDSSDAMIALKKTLPRFASTPSLSSAPCKACAVCKLFDQARGGTMNEPGALNTRCRMAR